MGIIAALVIGAIAGWLAGLIVRGAGFGLIGNIIVGIVGALVEPRKSVDHRGRQNRHRRDGSLHRELLLDVPGILPARGGIYARVGGHGGLQGPDCPPTEMAR